MNELSKPAFCAVLFVPVALGALALAGCADVVIGTGGAGGTGSSTSNTTSTKASSTVTGTGTTSATTTAATTSATTTGTTASTGTGGACVPSGTNSGANADCMTLCAAVFAPMCPEGPADPGDCEQACEGPFKTMCPMFDNFIDCGGANATWTCDTNPSGVKPSICLDEWNCMVADCFQ